MLHELLFHLLDGKNKQTLLDSEDFIHPGDQEILNQIMSIGSDYRLLQDSHRRMNSKCCVYTEVDVNALSNLENSFSDFRPGLYLKAFCNGLDDVLESYRQEVVRLEEVILDNPQLSMSYVLSRAMKFVPLFALLKSMLDMIKLEKVHGCLLVGWLHSYNNYGIDYIVQTAKRIQSSVNVIFYKQLANWLICGDLVDEYDEFFIEQSPDYTKECIDHTSTTATLSPAAGSSIGSRTIIGINQLDNTVIKQDTARDPMKTFRLRLSNLPEVIPLHLAEDILFTGQMVWIMREHDSSTDVWQNKSLDLIHRIQHLSTTFHLPSFTATVATCKSLVSLYLWSIITPSPTADNSQSLHQHLRLIRDYYCMGRGELFQQYVLAVHEMRMVADDRDGSQSAANNVGEMEARWRSGRLDRLFHETARGLYGEGDRSHERFTVLADGEMQFKASWPLDILVFNTQTLLQYTRIFQFLLRIQRTQSHLHQLWWAQHRTPNNLILKQHRTTAFSASSIAGSASATTTEHGALCGTSCWSLRHNLQFVVDNLQYYLHVDVIESQFAQFEHSLDGASSTSDVTSLHSKFLSGLLSRTFVMSGTNSDKNGDGKSDRMVYNIICHLLDLCNEFCSVTMIEGPLDSHILEPFQQRFHTMIEMLLRKLYSLHEKVSSGYHVLQLLHRLDFNRWYTKTLSASDLNLTKLRI